MSDLESHALAIINIKEVFQEIYLLSSEDNSSPLTRLGKISAASLQGGAITDRLLDAMKIVGIGD